MKVLRHDAIAHLSRQLPQPQRDAFLQRGIVCVGENEAVRIEVDGGGVNARAAGLEVGDALFHRGKMWNWVLGGME